MAGKITVSTINDSSGVLATQNGMTGIAKAFATWNGTNGTIYGTSFNVSSVTRNGTGDYTMNFTTALSNANYTIVSSSPQYQGVANGVVGWWTSGTRTTSAVEIRSINLSGSLTDFSYIEIAILGS